MAGPAVLMKAISDRHACDVIWDEFDPAWKNSKVLAMDHPSIRPVDSSHFKGVGPQLIRAKDVTSYVGKQ